MRINEGRGNGMSTKSTGKWYYPLENKSCEAMIKWLLEDRAFLKRVVDVAEDADVEKRQIKAIDEDIKLIQKQIRRNNGYKKIKVEKGDSTDYDRDVTLITFPVGTKMMFKMIWLYNQGYHYKSANFKVCIGDGRDCTGQLHSVDVEYNKNVVKIVSYYDL